MSPSATTYLSSAASHEGEAANLGESRAAALPVTAREREVIKLIALGRETSQIARELYISSETVRTHVRNAMTKLGAHTRAHLVAILVSSECPGADSPLLDLGPSKGGRA